MDVYERRLAVLASQLAAPAVEGVAQLARAHTNGGEPADAAAAALMAEDAYSVGLPEKLSSEGPWDVYRRVQGPQARGWGRQDVGHALGRCGGRPAPAGGPRSRAAAALRYAPPLRCTRAAECRPPPVGH